MTISKYFLLAFAALSIAIPSVATEEPINRLDKETVRDMTEEERVSRIAVLETRLSEIQEYDLKSMDRVERKETKKELRYINKELKAQANGGIYISASALVVIIIILLVI